FEEFRDPALTPRYPDEYWNRNIVVKLEHSPIDEEYIQRTSPNWAVTGVDECPEGNLIPFRIRTQL
ncbi:MAG: hypothetical protein ACRD6W_07795, partial [Nitrososphaerales archaeon]